MGEACRQSGGFSPSLQECPDTVEEWQKDVLKKRTASIPASALYTIVADEAFPRSSNIMKPYPHRNLEDSKRIFNFRL
ncbi:hypothetical protein UPYG_G00188060 [Umbra pygmaea]|uniref:DDE Tnp4 domain-containing protein n=1 Tax=Umbra pygmaea TaxID=75934 RepID=A0ABD0WTP4_UMBPY